MQHFIEHLYAQGLAESTIREYDKWIRRAERWCWTNRINLDHITPRQVREYSQTIPLTRSSQKAARASLCRYLTYKGRTDEPWNAIPLPPKPRQQSHALTVEDARLLRDAALMIGGHRETLATLCGLYLAARASEIAALTWDGWSGGRFKFYRMKNRDWHTVPVHPVLDERLSLAKQQAWSNYLFPGHSRPHVHPTTVWGWIRDIGSTVGVHVSSHQLRATAITTALEATKDLQAVQQLAGHRSPDITVGYARMSDDRLQAAVDALDY